MNMVNPIETKHDNTPVVTTTGMDGHQLDYENSAAPLKPSTRFSNPVDARGLAIQATMVATMVLNGDMDVDIAKVYSAVVRTAAQALSAEVQRARAARQVPDLTLGGGNNGPV